MINMMRDTQKAIDRIRRMQEAKWFDELFGDTVLGAYTDDEIEDIRRNNEKS